MRLLDSVTMYRVVLYALTAMALYAVAIALLGILPFSAVELLASFAAITAAAYATHAACVRIWKAPGNAESTFITALILFLILTPPSGFSSLAWTVATAVIAVAGKYVIVWRLRHLFNPAALALVAVGVAGYTGPEWWVGSRYMLPIVLIGGIAVMLKTRRSGLVTTYVAISSAVVIGLAGSLSAAGSALIFHFISWPTVFFATIMLTEPLGLPGSRAAQTAYAAIAALFSSIPFSIGPLHGTPELALLAANLWTFATDRPARLMLPFIGRAQVGNGTFEYRFSLAAPLRQRPGQYLEWTLPHSADTRGIRRYFTVVSDPAAPHVSFAARHADRQSSFKQALEKLSPGEPLFATQQAGDFLLANDGRPYVWLAGGIGITPFVSMLRDARTKGVQLPAVLLYCNKTERDIAFQDELTSLCAATGATLVHVLDAPGERVAFPHERGLVTEAMLRRHAPRLPDATMYLSGPPRFVDAYAALLRTMGVPRRRIVTDYFPGLA